MIDSHPQGRDRVPPTFGRELFEPDLDRMQPHLEKAMELVPCFQVRKITIRLGVNFGNISQAVFLYESVLQSFYVPWVWLVIFC